ncbi:MAG: hypothetical protein ACLFMY_06785 [Guyparkeria sp.]|uniref:hypothetical protein n=1 Tax=Guyparkeria sp. TaxID=2035736 RepID=UPI00397E1DC8
MNTCKRDYPASTRPEASIRKTALAVALAAGVVGGMIAASPSAWAGNPAIVSLTDPELDTMRGRYIAADNRVLYFGVEMITQWHTPDGDMQAGLTIGIDRGRGAPTVSFQPTVSIEGSPTASDSAGREIAGGGGDTRGVRQQIQVAGNDNSAHNGFEVVVTPYAGGEGSASAGQSGNTVQVLRQDGAVVASGLTGNGGSPGVTMQLGQSTAQQFIQRRGGANQMIRLSGDGQTIQNQLRLQVGMGRAQAMSRQDLHQQVGRSLANLRRTN